MELKPKQAPLTYRTGYAIQLVSLPNFTALLHKVKLQTNISNKQKKAHINPKSIRKVDRLDNIQNITSKIRYTLRMGMTHLYSPQ